MEATDILHAINDLPPYGRAQVKNQLKALIPPLPTDPEKLFPKLTSKLEDLASYLEDAHTASGEERRYNLCVFASALRMLDDEVMIAAKSI